MLSDKTKKLVDNKEEHVAKFEAFKVEFDELSQTA